MDPGAPVSVDPVSSSGHNNDSLPRASIIKWEFRPKHQHSPLTAYWYDAEQKPKLPEELEEGRFLPEAGNLIIGTKATLLIAGHYWDSPRIIPESRLREIGKPPRLLERAPGSGSMEDNHHLEFIMAAKGEKPADFPKSNFAYAGPMTETLQLGNVALRVGRRIEWDAVNLKVTNLDEANRYIRREARKGWAI